jgi:signal transduction histidine kinase
VDLRAVSAALGVVVLEREASGRFVRVSDPPPWWRRRMGAADGQGPIAVADVFPFLEAFLPDAERVWASPDAEPIVSEMWTESGPSGEYHLNAIATRVCDAAVLVISRNDQTFQQQQLLLQRARELRLTYTQLMREIERKDILLHTIVHDLTAPLHSIVGSLSLLRECNLPAGALRWTAIAIEAAARQRELIAGILSVFISEQAAGAAPVTTTVAIGRALQRAVAEREPVARQRRVELVSDFLNDERVRGEETRMLRVLTNLLDNAIRHSPPDGHVRITCLNENRALRICIEDDGPGVSPEMLPRLFQKLVRDPRGGGTGLGLYFCRITIEQWGGGIGYEPRESGGSIFWIRLPLAASSADQRESSEDHGETAIAR